MPTAGRAIAVHHDNARARGWGKTWRQLPLVTGDPGGPPASMQAAIASKLAPTGGSLRPRIGRTSLRVRPRPRRGLCSLPASIQAAVGVRRPLPQNPGSDRRSGAVPVGAALAAMQLLPSAGFDMSRCRGQKTPPTAPRRRPLIGHDPCESDLCGSGLGRDTAFAFRRFRCRPLSGSEDPSHRTSAPTADGTRFLWE